MSRCAPAPTSSLRARVARLAPIVAALLALGLYASTLTAANTYDAVIYALFVERVVATGAPFLDFFNPAHVAHLPLAAAACGALHALGIDVGGMLTLQVMAAAAGAAMAGLMVAVLARDTGVALASACAAGAALCAGTWFFATDGETNHLALAFALAALLPVRKLLDGGTSASGIVAGGVLLGVSAWFHLTLGTLWIALLALAAWRGRAVFVRAVASLSIASVTLAAAYVPRIVFLGRELPGWTLVDVISFRQESPGGGYLLREGFEPLAELLALMRGVAPGAGALAIAARILPWAWLVAALVALVRSWARRSPARTPEATLGKLSLLWFALTLMLYAAWASLNLEFATFMSTPLALAGACGLATLLPGPRARRAAALVTAALAAAIGLATWRGLIEPGLDPAANPYRRLADVIESATPPQDTILVSELAGDPAKVYVPYFAGRPTVVAEFTFGPEIGSDESVRRLAERLRAKCATGSRLHALPQIVEPWTGPPPAWDAEAVRRYVATLGPEPEVTDHQGRVLLYRLRLCPP